jgi:NAD(P)H dehydrogenase (quinone)
MPGNITAQGSPDDLNRLAGFLGAMAQSNADVGPEVAPAGSDVRTAAHLGRRVAEVAAHWPSGRLVGAGTVAA